MGFMLLLLMLGGCVSVGRVPEGPADFVAEGRMAVRAGGEGFAASFAWSQWADRYHIELWGPFGQGRTTLTGDGRRLVIVNGRGEELYRGPPDDLMRQQLGWSLPLQVLPAWLRGRPSEAFPADARRQDEGVLTEFDQLGWQVSYDRFRASDQGPLPGRVKARRDGARITIAVREWRA